MKEVCLLWSHQPETRWRDHTRTEIPEKALLIQLPAPQAASAQKTDQRDDKPSAANWLRPWEPPTRGPGLTVPGQPPTASQWLLCLLISYPPENQRRFSLEQNLCMHKCIKNHRNSSGKIVPSILTIVCGQKHGIAGVRGVGEFDFVSNFICFCINIFQRVCILL